MPVCIQKFEGGRLVSRICSKEEPFPKRPGETYDNVSSCAECPPFPQGLDLDVLKEEIRKIAETIREEFLKK
jgi:hypothetical protein